MGDRLWDEVLISLVTETVVAAFCFLSFRLWIYLMKLLKTPCLTAVGGSANDRPLPDRDAAANANGLSDVEMGNGYCPAQGGDSATKPQLELEIIVNSSEGIEHFGDQEAQTPIIESPVTTPNAQVITDAARGALVLVEMDVPRSQQDDAAAAE